MSAWLALQMPKKIKIKKKAKKTDKKVKPGQKNAKKKSY